MVQQDAFGNTGMSEKVILGRITGVYGVKGWLKVFSHTDPMEAIVDYSPWFIRPENLNPESPNRESPDCENQASWTQVGWTKVKLKAGKRHAKTVVVKLENCNSRDDAMAYIGKEIAIESQQLELLTKDEFYWRDLIGLQVINQQNITLGTVEKLLETGANDVLVVVDEAGIDKKIDKETDKEKEETKIERLIPWTMGIAIIKVDIAAGVISVDWDADF
ncbi:16S rRNA processing protein RimM [hydrothermal vent metagenome]|uniref:16S rRNA processing protein RimM n=1 Tax=hydrothermal vent metagenome TaxID=652676 RepID=A0A3B0W2U9_9ZZZZ